MTDTAQRPDLDHQPVSFADLTTLRVGGSARRLVRASSEAELVETVRAADAAGEPVLVLGGGSNLLVSDDGFDGVVVQDARTGVRVDAQDSCGGASFTVVAGHSWDDLVAEAVTNGWVGLEALSGIPGTVGAAPVQNVGAYGQEVSGVIASVRVYDRAEGRTRLLALSELGFGYRTSVLKRSTQQADDAGRTWRPTPRYVVLEVAFQARLGSLSAPVGYAELARTLGVDLGARAPMSEVREAVLALRAGKGMVLDAADPDTWSAGSFFTNPVVPADVALPEGAPRYPVRGVTPETTTGPSLGAVDPTLVKTSAAWLIEHAGYTRGFAVSGSRAALSSKHTLALTNRGGAHAGEIVALARVVRDGVREAFGVTLVPEPVLVGVEL